MSAPTWVYWPKPPLHGLSLNKSPIKNHATLFGLGWIVKPDQTKLGSTKPKNLCVHVSVHANHYKQLFIQKDHEHDIGVV